MELINYRKTVVGWYNFTVAGLMRYNVNPQTFRKVTGVSEGAALGACDLSAEQLDELRSESTYIGLADGWEWTQSDEQTSRVS